MICVVERMGANVMTEIGAVAGERVLAERLWSAY
jgi:hypothetical protein